MKRILLVACLVMLWMTTICSAEEQWEYVGDSKGCKTYVDVNSISYRPTTRSDFYRVKAKIENDVVMSIETLIVNADTKEYAYISLDSYRNGEKHSWSWSRDEWCGQYFDKEAFIVDKTIEIGNKQRTK